MNLLHSLSETLETNFSKAHKIAQYNASLPIEQGGLGLHPENTAKDRARAMGYDVDKPMYRGLSQEHSDDVKKNITWVSPDPKHAEGYAYGVGSPNMMKVYIKSHNPVHLGYSKQAIHVPFKDIKNRVKERILDAFQKGNVDRDTAKHEFDRVDNLPDQEGFKYHWQWRDDNPEFKEALRNVGYDSVSDHEVGYDTTDTIGLFHPSQVKSVNAAFDPMKKEGIMESNINHPMININGEMKHRNNSLGDPIHHTDEGIKNFHKWFGDSKVVDEHGRPKVVYHGSDKDFDEFKKTKGKVSHLLGTSEVDRDGHFFAEKESLSANFGESKPYYLNIKKPANLVNGYPDDVIDKLTSDGRSQRFFHNSYPSDIWSHFDEPHHIGKELQNVGYDGASIYEPRVDFDEFKHEGGITHIAFHPSQIKSVANKGSFSKETNKLHEAYDDELSDDHFKIDDWGRYNDKVKNFNNLEDHILPKNEIIKRYSTRGYETINKGLWKAKFKPESSNHYVSSHDITNIQNSIKSTNPSSDEHTLYSGIRKIPHSDGIVHIPSFISTSLSMDTAHHFAIDKLDDNNDYHILKIQTRKGDHLGNMINNAQVPHESEVLLPANSVLKIHKTNTYKDDWGYPIHVHTATIMNDKEIEANKDHPEVMSHLRMKKELGI